MARRSLSDILRNGDRESLSRAWGETEAAEDFAPLPSGEYVARIVGGELFTSRTKGTAGYKLAFRVLEGDHHGRQFWHDVWLTPAALPMAKRDLSKLGVTALEQLERPLPPGIRCKCKLALRKVGRLRRRGLLVQVFRGGINRGPPRYRVLPIPRPPKELGNRGSL
jgi:hypothetical protein